MDDALRGYSCGTLCTTPLCSACMSVLVDSFIIVPAVSPGAKSADNPKRTLSHRRDHELLGFLNADSGVTYKGAAISRGEVEW